MDLGVMSAMAEGGPMITGEWINSKTGEHVTVRDSYIDGDDMWVVLTNGKQLTMSEFQDYVQMSAETYDENGKQIANAPQTSFTESNTKKKDKPNYDPNLVFDGIDTTNIAVSPLQKQLLSKEAEELGLNLDNTDTQTYVQDNTPKQHNLTNKEQMILKILDKADAPKIEFNVKWDKCPKHELNMLKEYFDITDNDISNTIVRKYISIDNVADIVSEWVEKNI